MVQPWPLTYKGHLGSRDFIPFETSCMTFYLTSMDIISLSRTVLAIFDYLLKSSLWKCFLKAMILGAETMSAGWSSQLLTIRQSLLFDTRKYSTFWRSILMRLHSSVDLTGNVNMIEKFVLGGTGTGDLQILSPTRWPLSHQFTQNVEQWLNKIQYHFKILNFGMPCLWMLDLVHHWTYFVNESGSWCRPIIPRDSKIVFHYKFQSYLCLCISYSVCLENTLSKFNVTCTHAQLLQSFVFPVCMLRRMWLNDQYSITSYCNIHSGVASPGLLSTK